MASLKRPLRPPSQFDGLLPAIMTSTGPIGLSTQPGVGLPTPVAFGLIRDIGWRAIDPDYVNESTLAYRISSAEAQWVHLDLCALALGQFAVMGPQARQLFVSDLVRVINVRGDATGLEGLLISGLQGVWKAAVASRNLNLLREGLVAWERFGRRGRFAQEKVCFGFDVGTKILREWAPSELSNVTTDIPMGDLFAAAYQSVAEELGRKSANPGPRVEEPGRPSVPGPGRGQGPVMPGDMPLGPDNGRGTVRGPDFPTNIPGAPGQGPVMPGDMPLGPGDNYPGMLGGGYLPSAGSRRGPFTGAFQGEGPLGRIDQITDGYDKRASGDTKVTIGTALVVGTGVAIFGVLATGAVGGIAAVSTAGLAVVTIVGVAAAAGGAYLIVTGNDEKQAGEREIDADKERRDKERQEKKEKEQKEQKDDGKPDPNKKPGEGGKPNPNDHYPNPEDGGGGGPTTNSRYWMPAPDNPGGGGPSWSSYREAIAAGMPNPEDGTPGGPNSAVACTLPFLSGDVTFALVDISTSTSQVLGLPSITDAGEVSDLGLMEALLTGS